MLLTASICKTCAIPLFLRSRSLSHCQAVGMTFWPWSVHRHHARGRVDSRDFGGLPPGLLPPAALRRCAAAALDGPVRDAAVLVSLLPHRLHPAAGCQHGEQPAHMLSALTYTRILSLSNFVNVWVHYRPSTTSVFLTIQSSRLLWLKRTISWPTGKLHYMHLNHYLGSPIDF